MQIEIEIDERCQKPKIIIRTDKMTDEVGEIVKRLSAQQPKAGAGFRDGTVELLEPDSLLRVYTSGGKVLAQTERGAYQLRLRLYALEQRLDRQTFVRISHAEIVNLKKVKEFDLSLAGTICVRLADGTVTYVSRRYVARIKQILGI